VKTHSEMTSNGMPYNYDLICEGMLVEFYVDVTKDDKEKIKEAVKELYDQHDVVTHHVYKVTPYIEDN